MIEMCSMAASLFFFFVTVFQELRDWWEILLGDGT